MKRKTAKRIIIIVILLGLIGGSYATYLYFMPHRDVQDTEAFATLSSDDLVKEYLKDPQKANEKYLSSDGDSKVLIVNGLVYSSDVDQNGQFVVLIKNNKNEAGISCTFLTTSKIKPDDFKKGVNIKIKGAIRSGASYDEDLEMYEDVILEDCDIIK